MRENVRVVNKLWRWRGFSAKLRLLDREVRMLTGAVVALIVVGAIYGYTALRPVPPIGSNFGTVKTTFITSLSPDKAQAAIAAPLAAGANYRVAASDTAMHRVLLQDGMSMQSYGYYYPVDFQPVNDTTMVTVGIKSKYPLQLGPFVAKAQQKALDTMAQTLKAKLDSSPAT